MLPPSAEAGHEVFVRRKLLSANFQHVPRSRSYWQKLSLLVWLLSLLVGGLRGLSLRNSRLTASAFLRIMMPPFEGYVSNSHSVIPSHEFPSCLLLRSSFLDWSSSLFILFVLFFACYF